MGRMRPVQKGFGVGGVKVPDVLLKVELNVELKASWKVEFVVLSMVGGFVWCAPGLGGRDNGRVEQC